MKKSFTILCCFLMILCKGQDSSKTDIPKTPVQLTFEEKQGHATAGLPDPRFNFRQAAKKAAAGVVFIKVSYPSAGKGYETTDEFLYRLFENIDFSKLESYASGVIVSSNGYIVTNGHVVEDAEKIEVVLQDQRSYTAKIIGADNESDLALLKIEENNLDFIEFGNSDAVETGDWVLTAGSPFNLISTVTAGIVSAKARNIDIIERKGIVEPYIQTDAAMNEGSSGGALVDQNGKLIGINSAITSTTGAFAGYSFAIPSNIVKKITNDLIATGHVQRGYLGVLLKDVTAHESGQLHTNLCSGVYIDSLIEGGAALLSGLKLNDIITAVDSKKIATAAQLKEIMELHRPGETIVLTIIRNGNDEKTLPLILKDTDGNQPAKIITNEKVLSDLGIKIRELSPKEKRKMRLAGGVKITELAEGNIKRDTEIRKNFIITKVNGKRINTEDEFIKEIKKADSIVILEGLYKRSKMLYAAFILN